jgi:hypothetical protein
MNYGVGSAGSQFFLSSKSEEGQTYVVYLCRLS